MLECFVVLVNQDQEKYGYLKIKEVIQGVKMLVYIKYQAPGIANIYWDILKIGHSILKKLKFIKSTETLKFNQNILI